MHVCNNDHLHGCCSSYHIVAHLDIPIHTLTGFYLGFLVWGGKMLKVTVDGGCSHRSQFSRGVWRHAPPIFFLNFEPSESGSDS